MKLFLAFLLSSLILLFTYLFFHLGFFKQPNNLGLVEEEFFLLAQEHVGPYHKISDIIIGVEQWARQNHIPCSLTFGLYLDDPYMVDENRLRSEGGCLAKSDIYSEYNIKDNAKLMLKSLPLQTYLKLSFTGSPAIGPWKVYPLAEEWFKNTKYSRDKSVLEVYEVSGDKMTTFYYFPITDSPSEN